MRRTPRKEKKRKEKREEWKKVSRRITGKAILGDNFGIVATNALVLYVCGWLWVEKGFVTPPRLLPSYLTARIAKKI